MEAAMRGIAMLCAGLVSILGVAVARAGVGIGECGVCECADDGRRLCVQDAAVNRAECEEFCDSTDVIDFSAGIIQCREVPGCPQSLAPAAAPAAAPYGIVALLVALLSAGLWRIRAVR